MHDTDADRLRQILVQARQSIPEMQLRADTPFAAVEDVARE